MYELHSKLNNARVSQTGCGGRLRVGSCLWAMLGVVSVQACGAGSVVNGYENAPVAPVVTSTSIQCAQAFTLEGTKPASTSIQVDGDEVVTFSEGTTWSAPITATAAGGQSQTFNITAVDFQGRASPPATFTATIVSAVPAPPVLDGSLAITVGQSGFTLSGTKASGAAIVVNGVEVVPANSDTTFSAPLTLSPGTNQLQVAANNGCRDSTIVTHTVFYDVPTVTLTAPNDGASVQGTVNLTGTSSVTAPATLTSVEVRIDGGVWTAATGTTSWTYAWDTTSLDNFSGHTIEVRATDNGGRISPTVQIALVVVREAAGVSSDGTTATVGRNPAVAASRTAAGIAYIAWRDSTAADNEIYARKLTNGVLGSVVLISSSATDGNSRSVSLAVDKDGVAHVVWEDNGSLDGDATVDYDVVYATFDGTTVSAPTLISGATGDGASTNPRIQVGPDGTTLHVVWQEDGTLTGDPDGIDDVYYSQKGTGAWSAPELVSSHGNAISDGASNDNPKLDTDSDANVHVVWQCRGVNNPVDCSSAATQGCIDVCYRKRNDVGNWTSVAYASDANDTSSRAPDISADRGSNTDRAHIVWLSGAVFAVNQRTVEVGNNFGTVTTLSTESEAAASTAVAVDALGNANVCWSTATDILSTGTDRDVFMRRLTPAVQAYETVSVNAGNSDFPALATDASGNVYVAWEDDTSGTDQVLLTIR